jgi:hypothetical protein
MSAGDFRSRYRTFMETEAFEILEQIVAANGPERARSQRLLDRLSTLTGRRPSTGRRTG